MATAGDVNGDGYADVIVGAHHYDNGQTDEGRAFVYHGSAGGLSASAGLDRRERPGATLTSASRWRRPGTSTATATPTSSSARRDLRQRPDRRGPGLRLPRRGRRARRQRRPGPPRATRPAPASARSVATAGDVNGDGYADVIVGAHVYDNGQADEGRAFVYHGSAGGLSDHAGLDGRERPGRRRLRRLGGDGRRRQRRRLRRRHRRRAPYDNGQADEGRAFVYHGSRRRARAPARPGPPRATRPSAYFGWLGGDGRGRQRRRLRRRHRRRARLRQRPGGRGPGLRLPRLGRRAERQRRPGPPRATRQAPTSATRWRRRATSTATATPTSSSARLLRQRPDRRGPGLRLPRLGRRAERQRRPGPRRATRRGAVFGISVATAGDVNGDGYADVIVGAPDYDNGQTDEGRAFVYHGSAGGLEHQRGLDRREQPGGRPLRRLGGDGRGRQRRRLRRRHRRRRSTTTTARRDEGRAFVYHGAAGGLGASPAWTAESDQADAYFGCVCGDGGGRQRRRLRRRYRRAP